MIYRNLSLSKKYNRMETYNYYSNSFFPNRNKAVVSLMFSKRPNLLARDAYVNAKLRIIFKLAAISGSKNTFAKHRNPSKFSKCVIGIGLSACSDNTSRESKSLAKR